MDDKYRDLERLAYDFTGKRRFTAVVTGAEFCLRYPAITRDVRLLQLVDRIKLVGFCRDGMVRPF